MLIVICYSAFLNFVVKLTRRLAPEGAKAWHFCKVKNVTPTGHSTVSFSKTITEHLSTTKFTTKQCNKRLYRNKSVLSQMYFGTLAQRKSQ